MACFWLSDNPEPEEVVVVVVVVVGWTVIVTVAVAVWPDPLYAFTVKVCVPVSLDSGVQLKAPAVLMLALEADDPV
jgi:hypothetical protein